MRRRPVAGAARGKKNLNMLSMGRLDPFGKHVISVESVGKAFGTCGRSVSSNLTNKDFDTQDCVPVRPKSAKAV